MTENSRRCFRALTWTLVFGSILLSVSCSKKSGQVECFPVQGELYLEGKPAYKAVVWFHPVAETPPGSPRPHAIVKEDGSFEVGTFKSNDGAPAGQYKMTVIWREPPEAGDMDGPSLIPFRYMDPANSGLPDVEILPGDNTLPRVNLNKY